MYTRSTFFKLLGGAIALLGAITAACAWIKGSPFGLGVFGGAFLIAGVMLFGANNETGDHAVTPGFSRSACLAVAGIALAVGLFGLAHALNISPRGDQFSVRKEAGGALGVNTETVTPIFSADQAGPFVTLPTGFVLKAALVTDATMRESEAARSLLFLTDENPSLAKVSWFQGGGTLIVARTMRFSAGLQKVEVETESLQRANGNVEQLRAVALDPATGDSGLRGTLIPPPPAGSAKAPSEVELHLHAGTRVLLKLTAPLEIRG